MAGTLTISGSVGSLIECQINGSYCDGQASNDYYPSTTDGSTWETNWAARDLQQGGIVPLCISNEKEEVKDVRGLYEIWVVDPDEERVVFYVGGEDAIVADDEQQAKLYAAGAFAKFPFDKESLRKYVYKVRKICDVPKPETVQKVRVVKDE